ncbi:MAG: DUF433 domain-containing protein [Planctomycetota bacterium]
MDDIRIVSDETTRFGKPLIRGTRVAVDEVVGLLASGMSKEEVAAEFSIEIEDVHAALAYAAQSVANERR